MKQFYPDFESIHVFTLSLDFHQNELECAHCRQNDQFVSHGIIYKQRSGSFTEKVGKRIFCSNRCGRKGCGRTFQLYVANEVPSCRYGAAHLFVFISALMAKLNIEEAYLKATGQSESRHAWRWLKKFMVKLSEYRSFLKVRQVPQDSCAHQTRSSSRYLRHLLPTFARLLASPHKGCAHYQMMQQRPFF